MIDYNTCAENQGQIEKKSTRACMFLYAASEDIRWNTRFLSIVGSLVEMEIAVDTRCNCSEASESDHGSDL